MVEAGPLWSFPLSAMSIKGTTEDRPEEDRPGQGKAGERERMAHGRGRWKILEEDRLGSTSQGDPSEGR